MIVPASPTSISACPVSGAGRTSQRSSSAVDTPTPRARIAAAISSVSRARSGRSIVAGPPARALSTRARAVIDLEPGSRTDVVTGPAAVGAVQGTGFGTPTVCRSAGAKWPGKWGTPRTTVSA